jgi:hypothetical protein
MAFPHGTNILKEAPQDICSFQNTSKRYFPGAGAAAEIPASVKQIVRQPESAIESTPA